MASSGTKPNSEELPPLPQHTVEKLCHTVYEANVRHAVLNKKLMSHQCELKGYMHRQDASTKKIEDSLAFLIASSQNYNKDQPNTHTTSVNSRWRPPPSLLPPPHDVVPDTLVKVKPEPPRFNGENAPDWIRKIQKYYNHYFTPLYYRIYLTSYLLDHPASSWLSYWEDNCKNKTWEEFLIAVKHRFDPDLYIDHLGTLANLRQTGSVETYQTAFEDTMQRLSNVSDDTLMSLFIAGLQEPIRQDLLIKRPVSLNDAFALAQQVAACQALTAGASSYSKPHWTECDNRPKQTQAGLTATAQHRQGMLQQGRGGPNQQPRPHIPIVKIFAAEHAEKIKRGECCYCPEKYTREHVCSKKFYAVIGADEDDEPEENSDQPDYDIDAENMVITGDVSSVHVISPKLKPRSIRLSGMTNGSPVSVLIDGGSTHNFIKPAVAEQLSLPVHSVNHFRVFVGNGESLHCPYACLKMPISLQEHPFMIDLFVLQVEGPDVILGVQWLQELGDVTKNYKKLTMKFELDDKSNFLQGDGSPTATTPDHFPIPTADELFDELHAARVFSKLDLRSGYLQIRMYVDDIHKTAFRTHDGHFGSYLCLLA